MVPESAVKVLLEVTFSDSLGSFFASVVRLQPLLELQPGARWAREKVKR
jgi:hypothetical protein